MSCVYPVIMCGGAGSRLWPTSTADSPKQFVKLISDQSLFQQTASRLVGLDGFERLIVITRHSYQDEIALQLSKLGIEAELILEPQGRDSAAAVATATAYIAGQNDNAVAVIVASDHCIPDVEHFQSDVAKAVKAAASGCIVTVGIKPDEPSSAYGYIKPSKGRNQIVAVEKFVEKPSSVVAEKYLADGYLWNSGNFVASIKTLLSEFATHAPDILRDAELALQQGSASSHGTVLGECFRDIRATSIDYAIMEKTENAMVLKSQLNWSDLGAWDSVYDVLDKDDQGNVIWGNGICINAAQTLVRASEGRAVVVSDIDRVMVIVEGDTVLVSRLENSQNVKKVVEHLKSSGNPIVSKVKSTYDIESDSEYLTQWLNTIALPLWCCLGLDRQTCTWNENLSHNALETGTSRRAGVQGRQAFVYALAGKSNWTGPWRDTVGKTLKGISEKYVGPKGLLHTLVCEDGNILDDGVLLYDQTFLILALAVLDTSLEFDDGIEGTDCWTQIIDSLTGNLHSAKRPDNAGKKTSAAYSPCRLLAEDLLTKIEAEFLPADRDGKPGFVEFGEDPYQSNAHMHLFEAAIEWVEAGKIGENDVSRWWDLATELAELAIDHFIDKEGGFVHEFFDERWQPVAGERDTVEPGHQFEWAWLFARWSQLTEDELFLDHARKLFDAGIKGINGETGTAVDTMDGKLMPITRRSRFWPQTEWFKAALILHDNADSSMRGFYLSQAERARKAISLYLDQPIAGLWSDKLDADSGMQVEPTPTSTFYHIASAIFQLQKSAKLAEQRRELA